MRRIFAMALCLLLLVTAVPFRAEAAGYEEEGDFLYTVSNGQAFVSATDRDWVMVNVILWRPET